MRADIKVGMVIAVILIGAGVMWFVFFRPPAPTAGPIPSPEDTTVTDKTDDSYFVVTSPPVTPTVDQTPALTSTDPLIRSAYRERATETTTRQTGDAEASGVTAARSAAGTGEWGDVPDRTKRTPSIWKTTETTETTGATGTTVATDPTARLLATAGKTYIVKKGDSYWSIAQSQWGNGTLHTYLEKANPRISPGDLRPRMTIKIPPKPVRTSSSSVSAAVAAERRGTTGVDLRTGKRYYIVKEGDRGFWDISKAVYGEGRHWKAIESSNPKLDSRKLRAGQKVWCPDKPVKPARVAVTPERTGTVYAGSATTAPAAVTTGGADAPTRTTLPDGRIFD